jgi:hypothetical protein
MPDDKKPEITMDDVVAGMRHIMGLVSGLDKKFSAAESRFGSIESRFETIRAQGQATPPTAPAKKEEVDLESLSNKELVKHLLSEVNEAVAKNIEPFTKKLLSLEERTDRGALKSDLEKTLERNPDTLEYRDEISALMKDMPDLTVERALVLARAEAPDKTKAISDRRAAEEKVVADKRAAEIEEEFGGLLPTSGRSVTSGDKKMSTEQAENEAWDKVFGGTPWDRILSSNSQ